MPRSLNVSRHIVIRNDGIVNRYKSHNKKKMHACKKSRNNVAGGTEKSLSHECYISCVKVLCIQIKPGTTRAYEHKKHIVSLMLKNCCCLPEQRTVASMPTRIS